MVRDRGKARPERVVHSEDTLMEVYLALSKEGITGAKAIDIVNAMQNEGLLFREREEL